MFEREELDKYKYAIYKFVYLNPGTHRNILRKKLLFQGKIASKSKFSTALNELINEGKLSISQECISIADHAIILGVLQRKGEFCYVVTQNSNKHYFVDKNSAAGYTSGTLLDVVVNNSNDDEAFILGKNQTHHKEVKTETKTNNQATHHNFTPIKENAVLGRVVKLSHDNLIFIPNNKSLPTRQIPILNAKEDYSKFQDKICIMSLVDLDAPLLGGYIVEIKGDAGNPIHEFDSIAENYGANMSWEGEQLENEIAKIPTTIDTSNMKFISEEEAKYIARGNVVDLRHIPFVTIDPATCKDMDDAIYSCYNENGDFVSYTAVANVTKYVNLDSEIGKRYIDGCFTIYAPNKAYNILPTKLSTGICSLNPNEDRLAFVVKTVIDPTTGAVKDRQIYDSIIRSRKKYSYEEAQEIVDSLETSISKEDLLYKTMRKEELSLDEHILMDYYCAKAIKTGFERRKMIRFVSAKERDIVFDDDLKTVIDIKPIPHLYYHEVIEAFMVTANETSAKYTLDHNLDNVFRVHDQPNPKKLNRASEFFNILGINFDGDLSAESTRNLIDLIRDTTNEELINNFLIKMQSRAQYSTHPYGDNKNIETDWSTPLISHYALQSSHYSHTTAPIRRLVDYVTQYNILAHMHGTSPISQKTIQTIVEHANDRQIEVDQAERDFEDISSVLYCEKHIGEVMSGRVTKIRPSSTDEDYEDEIVVIVRNEERGINVEIPLSQILGRPCLDCEISSQRCAVYDRRGNTLLTICKPVDFIVERADRKTMRVIGKTNKVLIKNAEAKDKTNYTPNRHLTVGQRHTQDKNNRAKRIESKKSHHGNNRDEEDDMNK